MRLIRVLPLATTLAALLLAFSAFAATAPAKAKSPPPPPAAHAATGRYMECPAGMHRDPACIDPAARTGGDSACACTSDAGNTPAPGARKVKSGTIKLQCPAGTEKLCNGNDCGCWTQTN